VRPIDAPKKPEKPGRRSKDAVLGTAG
jgi:hypothetical protein